jgi:hypothetical protein
MTLSRAQLAAEREASRSRQAEKAAPAIQAVRDSEERRRARGNPFRRQRIGSAIEMQRERAGDYLPPATGEVF